MKVIERWYEKLLGYDWFYRLQRFTLMEWVVIVLVVSAMAYSFFGWLIFGDV
jgi:hypothetical protein